MQIKKIFTCALLVAALTACNNTTVQTHEIVETKTETQQETMSETQQETMSETLSQTQQTTVVTQNTVDETVTTTNTQIVNRSVAFDVETLADTYAQIVIERIKADKETKEEYNRFRPLYADDFMKIHSLMYLLDVNFDGVPELFIGTSGTIGGGSYDIIKSDGTLLGKDVHCCSWLTDASVIDDVMYMFNGRGPNPGWVKLVEGTPSVTLQSWLNTEEAVNTVDVNKADGTIETFENQSLDDIKALYKQYLDVDYDLLHDNADAPATLISGVLTVPDPEQYTVIDISACVKALLEEYVVQNSPVENTVVNNNKVTADVETWSRNFAHALAADMTAGTAEITPISIEHEVVVFDVDAMLADIFFIDVNNDGLPEMFAGGHGTMGSGRYSIYDTIGNCWGTDIFIWDVLSFETDGKNMYASTGSNSTPGHTKLVAGLPQIHANGFAFTEGKTTDVTVKTATGESVNTTATTTEEFENLYAQYLDVDYSALSVIDADSTVYVREHLRVPDVNNYTEDDIYNCILPLVTEYVMQETKT